jgi:hypothetical protein
VERLNQWMTLVANIGVVAGIVFLGFEIQQTGDAINAQTYQTRAEGSRQQMMEIADSQLLAPLLSKVAAQGGFHAVVAEDLTEEEKQRLRSYGHAMRIALDNQQYQYERGFLDEDYYQSTFIPAIQQFAPLWTAFSGLPLRPSFEEVVQRHSQP